uniref:Fascin actin-bundling protein 3 n=1 Tax=Molossus molossus TaxID=27622 RepID=A0A7J8HBD0_MOLMO|nr:fascin actin-bundling protein 3 [Molossus molossus]
MDEVEWTPRQPKPEDLRVGLISWAGSYLTYEPYNHMITAAAKGLGRRQTWEILVSNEHETQAVVRLRSLQGLYLLCEADGNLYYDRPRTSHHGSFLLRFHRNDRLASQPSSQTAFHMQVRPGGLVALSDGEGGMLYAQGPRLLLALGSNPHRGEEWFILQRCPAWVSLRSKTRKFLSVIYDVEIYAASEHLTPMSLFQFESENGSPILQLRSANGFYLAQRRHRTVVANGYHLESDTFFRMHWNCGRIILQSPNGRFLGIAPNSLLIANASIPGPNEEFGIRLANRPFLALRGRYGYVGTSPEHDLMQCNMDQPSCIHLLPCRQGIYHFQAQCGSFWSITSFGTFRPWGKFALNFCIELQGSNLLTVLAPNGFYMRSDRSGTLLADSEDITKECIWEF